MLLIINTRIDRLATLGEGGFLYRAFEYVAGFAVALLSVTGIWSWLRTRANRS